MQCKTPRKAGALPSAEMVAIRCSDLAMLCDLKKPTGVHVASCQPQLLAGSCRRCLPLAVASVWQCLCEALHRD